MHTSIYPPAEDSYLMTKILKEEIPSMLKNNPGLKFLEIGAGSGIHLETAFNSGVKKQNISASDINHFSVEHCNLLGFNCIQSDLFEKFNSDNPKNKFDLIIFNPPYLQEDKREDKESSVATTGGKRGSEIIIKFLKQAKKFLNPSGKIFLITSSLAEKVNFNSLGYEEEEIKSEKLFFETIYLWELKLK